MSGIQFEYEEKRDKATGTWLVALGVWNLLGAFAYLVDFKWLAASLVFTFPIGIFLVLLWWKDFRWQAFATLLGSLPTLIGILHLISLVFSGDD